MKRFVLFSIVFALSACTNPAIDIESRLTVTVSPSTVLSALKFYSSSNSDMYSDDDGTSVLRLTALLYDDTGNLVDSKEATVDDYSKNCDFSFSISNEDEYRLICFSSCIQGTLSKPVYQAYEIDDIANLNTLKVIQVDENSYYSTLSILGGASADVSAKNGNVKVNLLPLTSLVYTKWIDIHAHDGEEDTPVSVYGTYKASTDNYWGTKSFSWDIVVEKDGSSSTNVIIKNLDPYLTSYGYTAEKGYNIYNGVIEGNRIRVPAGQKTGYINSDNKDLLLEGVSKVEGNTLYFGDLYLLISNGKLTTQNMFGVQVKGDDGWYSLYNSGIVFMQNTGSSGIDMYGFIYHNNDYLTCSSSGFVFGTSLSSTDNNGTWVETANNPGNNIYSMINLFPGTFNMFCRTITGNDREDYSEGAVTLEQGKQYVMTFDCKNYRFTLSPGLEAMTKSTFAFDELVMLLKKPSFKDFHPIEEPVQLAFPN